MEWYYWIGIVSLVVCITGCIYHFIKLIKLGSPRDYSKKSGSTTSGIVYSFTHAMNPLNKESAFLNLPTYVSGVIYHLGTFLAIVLFFVFFITTNLHELISLLLAAFLLLSALCGVGMLIKRITDKKLRHLSNPDDYISNILVTLFQLGSGAVLFIPGVYPVYMVIASLLLLYIPLGKLKHMIYFFAARYHIGYFYGWRNVWPKAKLK